MRGHAAPATNWLRVACRLQPPNFPPSLCKGPTTMLRLPPTHIRSSRNPLFTSMPLQEAMVARSLLWQAACPLLLLMLAAPCGQGLDPCKDPRESSSISVQLSER